MKRKHGFSLPEVMIVIAIIALLSAIAVPNFLDARKRSLADRKQVEKDSTVVHDVHKLANNGRYEVCLVEKYGHKFVVVFTTDGVAMSEVKD